MKKYARRHILSATLFLLGLLVLPVAGMGAQGQDAADTAGAAKDAKSAPAAQREAVKASVTEHVLQLPSGPLAYTATAGEMLVEPGGPTEGTAGKDKPTARIFSVSYVRKDADSARRPVTFAFNGGPGSASVWLHLGALGPRRVELAPDGRPLPPPARLTDNLETWLAFTDLVFIDPVGTGYSRVEGAGGKEAEAFLGVKQDLAAVSEFVRLWLARNGRWLSPKFLVGESYGTTRAAALAGQLFETYGVAVNGVMLVSPVLSFDTILFAGGNDLPYPLYLPTYAAVARFHGKAGGASPDEAWRAAEEFAYAEYLPALARGDALSPEARARLRARLAELTGLDPELLERSRERVRPEVFFKALLKNEKRMLGRMDGSVTSPDLDPARPYPAFDPSLEPLFGPFSAGINAYLRTELKYESDLVYEFLNGAVNRSWDWSSGLPERQGYVDVADELAAAMVMNPALKVVLSCGVYDMATPLAAAEYTVRHLGLPEALRQNVRIDRYEAGHMMYTHEASRRKLAADAAAFYAAATAGTEGGR